MNATYIAIDLRRHLRDWSNLMFTLLLPVAMYVLFGASNSDGGQMTMHANVRFYVMSSMAAYGAALACTSTAAQAASESMLGWGRQLALTRQPAYGFVANKVVVAFALATVASALVFLVGWATGAEADHWWLWLATFAITIGGGAMFALYGLAVGLAFRSETAASIASGSLVFLAFFGNMFLPLGGTMLTIAKFSPMYGYATLVRWPTTEGWLTDGTSDSLWLAVVNFVVWTAIFAVTAVLASRRARARR